MTRTKPIPWFSISSNSCAFDYNKSTTISKWKNSLFLQKSSIFIPRIKFCFRNFLFYYFDSMEFDSRSELARSNRFSASDIGLTEVFSEIFEKVKNLLSSRTLVSDSERSELDTHSSCMNIWRSKIKIRLLFLEIRLELSLSLPRIFLAENRTSARVRPLILMYLLVQFLLSSCPKKRCSTLIQSLGFTSYFP